MDMYLDYLNKKIRELLKENSPDHHMLAILLKEFLKYNPEDSNLLFGLSKAIFEKGIFPGEALRLAKKTLRLDPNSPARSIVNLIDNFSPPQNLSVEVSTVCNLKCPLCDNGAGTLTRDKKFMSLENFYKIWNNLGNNIREILLFGLGETFLHPQIYEILGIIKGTPNILIDTNGNTEMDYHRVIDSGVSRIVFSVDGINQQMYERYRVNGNFEKAINNIKGLVEAKSQMGAKNPKIVFKLIIFKHTEKYTKEFQQLGNSLGVDEVTFTACHVDPKFSKELCYNYLPESSEILRLAYIDFEKKVVRPHWTNDSQSCMEILRSCYVTVNGLVVPCCESDEKWAMGNLCENTLEDIWRSPRYRNFRQQVLENRWQVDLCRVCTMPKPTLGKLFSDSPLEEPDPDIYSREESRIYLDR